MSEPEPLSHGDDADITRLHAVGDDPRVEPDADLPGMAQAASQAESPLPSDARAQAGRGANVAPGLMSRLTWFGGAVGQSLARLLGTAKRAVVERDRTVLTNPEAAALLTGAQNAERIDSRSRFWLTRGLAKQQRRRQRHDRVVVAIATLTAEVKDSVVLPASSDERSAILRPGVMAVRSTTARSMYLAHRSLTVFELIVILAEAGFWYQLGAQNIARSVPVLSTERLGSILLAVMLPAAGICLGRVTATCWGKLLAPGGEGRRRAADRWAGALASTIMFTITMAVTWVLVRWRFTQGLSFGSKVMPGGPTATIFVAFVVGLMLARTFAIDHATIDDDRDRQRFVRLERRRVRRLAAWRRADGSLRLRIEGRLSLIARVCAISETMLLSSRALRTDDPETAGVVDDATHASNATCSSDPWHLDLTRLPVRLHVLPEALERFHANRAPEETRADGGVDDPSVPPEVSDDERGENESV